MNQDNLPPSAALFHGKPYTPPEVDTLVLRIEIAGQHEALLGEPKWGSSWKVSKRRRSYNEYARRTEYGWTARHKKLDIHLDAYGLHKQGDGVHGHIDLTIQVPTLQDAIERGGTANLNFGVPGTYQRRRLIFTIIKEVIERKLLVKLQHDIADTPVLRLDAFVDLLPRSKSQLRKVLSRPAHVAHTASRGSGSFTSASVGHDHEEDGTFTIHRNAAKGGDPKARSQPTRHYDRARKTRNKLRDKYKKDRARRDKVWNEVKELVFGVIRLEAEHGRGGLRGCVLPQEVDDHGAVKKWTKEPVLLRHLGEHLFKAILTQRLKEQGILPGRAILVARQPEDILDFLLNGPHQANEETKISHYFAAQYYVLLKVGNTTAAELGFKVRKLRKHVEDKINATFVLDEDGKVDQADVEDMSELLWSAVEARHPDAERRGGWSLEPKLVALLRAEAPGLARFGEVDDLPDGVEPVEGVSDDVAEAAGVDIYALLADLDEDGDEDVGGGEDEDKDEDEDEVPVSQDIDQDAVRLAVHGVEEIDADSPLTVSPARTHPGAWHAAPTDEHPDREVFGIRYRSRRRMYVHEVARYGDMLCLGEFDGFVIERDYDEFCNAADAANIEAADLVLAYVEHGRFARNVSVSEMADRVARGSFPAGEVVGKLNLLKPGREDHKVVLEDLYLDWHARHGSSATSPKTTDADDDADEPEANERERERGEGVGVEQVVAYLDAVVEGFEEREGGG